MKQIKLTTGDFAIVDDDDFDLLSLYKWRNDVGYARRIVLTLTGYKGVLMHREIINAPKNMEVDHINGNRLDNRKSNLRLCTRSQNQINIPPYATNTSGYKGVTYHKKSGKWQASIGHNGRLIYLGLYDSAIEAAKNYDEKAKELYGDFAFLNFGVKL